MFIRPSLQWPILRVRWALVALLLLGVHGLWLTAVVHLDLRASGFSTPWSRPLVWELTSAVWVWALLPLVQVVALNAPWTREGWVRCLGWHGVGVAIFWVIHVLGMWLLRIWIYDLAGWEPYEYGRMAYRMPMEGLKDVLTFAGGSLLFQYIARRQARQQQELAAARLEAELREARLQALAAQVDPHFLFNALNTLSSVMYEDLDQADRLLANLGQMLRAGLTQQGPTWSLADEMDHLGHYVSMVEARFGDRVQVATAVPGDVAQAQVPRFSLQRLVENAVKHNAHSPGRSLQIRVEGQVDGATLHLLVQDDGQGFQSGAAEGVGIQNLRRSVELLWGLRGRVALGNNAEGGGWVRLSLPWEPRHA